MNPIKKKFLGELNDFECAVLSLEKCMQSIREEANLQKSRSFVYGSYNSYLKGRLDGSFSTTINHSIYGKWGGSSDCSALRDLWYAYTKEADFLLGEYIE